MLRFVERYQTAIVILAAIVLPLVVYRANSVDPAEANVVDRLVMAASAPVKGLLFSAVSSVSEAWYGYVDLTGARAENGALRRRAYAAERERDRLAALALENRSLRALLLIREQNPAHRPVEANVIAAGSSLFSRSLEIDRGSMDGVSRGQVVVAEDGLVGTVVRVGWTTAEVMIVADERLSVSVRVARSRARGRIHGLGLSPGFALELSEVLRAGDMLPGDRVETSGLGGVFPGGIPVGEVRQVRTPTGAQHRVGDVEPYVDFARLERVLILESSPKDSELRTPEPLRPPSLRGGFVAPPEPAADAGRPDAQPAPRRERPPSRDGALEPPLDGGGEGGRADAGQEDSEAPPDAEAAADAGLAATATAALAGEAPGAP